jgi:hypothetical protein
MTIMTTTVEASDRSRLARSSLIAIGFWIAVAIALAVIPMTARKPVAPKYSTVRITLNEVRQPATDTPVAVPATPVAATATPVAVPSEPAKATPAAPAVSRSAKAAAKAAAAKDAVKAAQPAATTAKPAAQNSTAGGLGIPNFSTPVTGSTRSESSGEYLDFQSEERRPRTDSASPANASSVSEFEGVAAPLASPSAAKSAVTGTSGAKPSSGAASGETERALGELTGAKAAGTAGTAETRTSATSTMATGTTATGTTTSNPSAPRASSSSVSSLAFDGVARKLIQPEKPSIALPDDLARLITSNRSVVVSFTIRADGSVPAGLVEFSPSAVLPARVRDWLAREFSGWRFERSGEDGQARFSYSIKVE